MTFRSMSGGTGSGVGAKVSEQLTEHFGKTNKYEIDIFPSPKYVFFLLIIILYRDKHKST